MLVYLGTLFFSVNLVIPKLLSGALNIYLAQPILWSYLALIGYVGWRYVGKAEVRPSKVLLFMAVLVGMFQVAVLAIAGLIFGFGRSPYSHSFPVILGNLLFVASVLVGTELSRAYLLAKMSRRRPLLSMALVAVAFSALSIPGARMRFDGGIGSIFLLSGETVLPIFSENLLASLLSIIGGPLPAIAYRGTLEVFEWLSPVLPDLHWTLAAFLGTLVPGLGMLIIHNQFVSAPTSQRPSISRADRPSPSWVLVALASVTLIWFNTGLFGVRPSLIAGVSMEPYMGLGDVAVTKDVEAEDVTVGDVIRFRQGGVYILHRVVDLQRLDGELHFVTRGDANNVNDPLIAASQLEGKLVLVVPKIGWLGILPRMLLGAIR